MSTEAALKYLDELIFSKTGKHLDDLQEAILKGTLQSQTYQQIAVKVHRSEGHIRDEGSKLWKLLSEIFAEEVNKANFKTTLERSFLNNISISSPFGKNILRIDSINICSETPQTPLHSPQSLTKPYIDLGYAPENTTFYGRIEELKTLENWLNNHTRLITILGLEGIGKTSLTLQLIEQIKPNFDYIIYRSLSFAPTLTQTLTKLLQIFSNETDITQTLENQLSQLINYLRNNRCLIILDDLQSLYSRGKLAEKYQIEYQDYRLLFKLIAQNSHQSCLILNSREKSEEIIALEQDTFHVNSLVLQGLGDDAQNIFKDKNLLNEDSWNTLINNYQGHPLWLKQIASMIQELFNGSVAEFLACDTLILSEAIQLQFDKQFQSLTPEERAIMIHIANESERVSAATLLTKINNSSSVILNAIQSLVRRLLLTPYFENSKTLFEINPVLKQYVKLHHKNI